MKLDLVGVLGIIFIVLKLTDLITWSWLWVLSPFWIPLALAIPLWIVWAAAIISSNNKDK